MRIRLLHLIVGGGGLALNALALPPELPKRQPAIAAENTGTVTMPLSELQKLWEKTQPKPPSQPVRPVVPAVLQELTLELALHPVRCRGVAKVKATSFSQDWQRLPLFGGALTVESLPAEAAVDVDKAGYGLLLQATGAQSLELDISLPGTAEWKEDDSQVIELPAATTRRILFRDVPKGMAVVVGETTHLPTASGEVVISLKPAETDVAPRLVKAAEPGASPTGIQLAQVTVPLLTCQQRLVLDGGLLTSATFEFRHQSGTSVVLTLPPGADLLQCALNGAATRPVRRENDIEVMLAEVQPEGTGSKLELTYFTKLPPLTAASGSLTLALPGTPLFHERLDWTITLPEGIAATAMNSNAESAKAVQGSRELTLRREFWKGDPVTAEIFYQKRQP